MSVQAGAIGISVVYRVYQADGVTPMNLALASVKKLIFTKPNLQTLEVTASFYTDGTDGLLKYTTATADDLGPYGTYQVQAYVEIPPNYKSKAGVALFDVLGNAA